MIIASKGGTSCVQTSWCLCWEPSQPFRLYQGDWVMLLAAGFWREDVEGQSLPARCTRNRHTQARLDRLGTKHHCPHVPPPQVLLIVLPEGGLCECVWGGGSWGACARIVLVRVVSAALRTFPAFPHQTHRPLCQAVVPVHAAFCTHTHTHTPVYVHACACTYTHIYMFMHARAHTCTSSCAHAHTHAHAHTRRQQC
jgi:hypothetical protein